MQKNTKAKEKKVILMKIGLKIPSQITRNADKIGLVGGFYMGANALASAFDYSALSQIQDSLLGILNDPHFPDLGHVMNDLKDGYASKPFKTSVKVALVGEGLKMIGFQTKWGNLMAKVGWNAAKGVILWSLVHHSGLAHSNIGTPDEVTAMYDRSVTQANLYSRQVPYQRDRAVNPFQRA